MNRAQPRADAVATRDVGIVAVRSVDEVLAECVGQNFVIDDRFHDSVLIAGLIDQHYIWLSVPARSPLKSSRPKIGCCLNQRTSQQTPQTNMTPGFAKQTNA